MREPAMVAATTSANQVGVNVLGEEGWGKVVNSGTLISTMIVRNAPSPRRVNALFTDTEWDGKSRGPSHAPARAAAATTTALMGNAQRKATGIECKPKLTAGYFTYQKRSLAGATSRSNMATAVRSLLPGQKAYTANTVRLQPAAHAKALRRWWRGEKSQATRGNPKMTCSTNP